MDSFFDRRWMLLEPAQAPMAAAVLAAGVSPLVLFDRPDRFAVGRLPQGASAAGSLEVGEPLIEPYGEVPFPQAVADCRRIARGFQEAGAACLVLHGAKSLIQARAALLGARETGLPVLLVTDLLGEGETLRGGGDILSAFVVLQELGMAAFGFSADTAGIGVAADPLRRIRPYSRVPLALTARDLARSLPQEEAKEQAARWARGMAELGVGILGAFGSGEEEIAAAAQALAETDPAPLDRIDYLAAEEIWAANETQVYYLDSNMEYSPPIPCALDMADAVIQAEHEGWDAVCVEVLTPDEGDSISQNNAHLSRTPVVFLSDDPAALGAALFAYNGRAIVDSRSQLEPEELARIAAKYGAVVL